jgi:hypothetical protein
MYGLFNVMTLEKLLWRKKVGKLLGGHVMNPRLLRVAQRKGGILLVVDELLLFPRRQ